MLYEFISKARTWRWKEESVMTGQAWMFRWLGGGDVLAVVPPGSVVRCLESLDNFLVVGLGHLEAALRRVVAKFSGGRPSGV